MNDSIVTHKSLSRTSYLLLARTVPAVGTHSTNYWYGQYQLLVRCLVLALFLLLLAPLTAWGQTTYTYYALHNKDKGYLKQYKGIVGNDGTFRYENAYNDIGSSMWVYSSDGYLQQEMYYLNVLNGQTLVLSTTPETQWDLVTDGVKKRFRLHGSTKILGFDGSKVVLADSPTYKYAACTLTVTENNSKWDGPKDASWTVQSPQLVTYLRTYYLRNITVTIDKNDAGTENVKVVDKKDSRCYCKLTYKNTSNADKGTKWDINTTTGIVYNMTTSQVKNVAATYEAAPLNPIVLAYHAASDQTITLTINAKALSPNSSKKYLLFNTQDGNYRFPKASSSISEGDLLPVDGKQSDLTEAVNGDISYEIEVDDEGFCSFKNVTTGRYLYYDAADYTVSDYGAVKIGSDAPGSDMRYKFRLYSSAGNRDPFGSCLYIIPYDKQFAVWKSDGVLAEHYFALYMNTSGSTKIASIYKASDNAKWKIYAYEWEYRLWDNWSISGDQYLHALGNYSYTASTWFSRNINGSPTNAEHLMLPNSKTHDGITYTWTLTGLDDYISTSDVLASGTSTMTASVNSLPPGTRTGTLTVKASISSPANRNNSKSISISLYNLNPTLTEISNLSEITDANGLYKLTADNVYSSDNKPVDNFSGTLDGGGFTISGLTAPLFTTLDGGTVRNLNLDNVNVTSGDNEGNTGAIACVAQGAARIYNVGILATNSSTVSGSGYTGGLVGKLDGEARVINCYSYANITGGTTVGGIVGYNNVATTSANLKTMVMNCMFYGNITGGTDKAPIYNGKNIVNKEANGVSNFNYFWGDANYVKNQQINTYNCALMAETRFLQRFEFFRHLLNSHRELAAWWATGSTANKDQMMKWVLEPSQIGSSTPYPILKTPGYYPSVVNIDAEHAATQAERNKGGLLGTLSVTINMGSGGEQFAPPAGASITTPSLTLNITDKDPDHFNFNYAKVQLPYYNDVGTGNYTGNRVVTGWKITSITGGTQGSYTTGDDATANAEGEITAAPYNFADRQCTNKDLYEVSGRVFNQGAYWDVPEGVTAITIEPYWAKAAYLADANVDVVYDQVMNNAYNVPNVGGGQIYTNDKNYSIAGESQKVYTDIGNAANALGKHSGHSVYDYAIVLVGNYHKHNGISSGDASHFYTIMSADFDHDNEPDYSYILRYNSRTQTHPVRVDFLNLPGLGMAQKSTGSNGSYNFGIMQPIGWFESTNTSLFRVTQFEYDRSDRVAAPLILQGGVMEQWVSGQANSVANKTTYFHVGGNVWFKEFHRGTHQDQSYTSKHPPVSVTGGDFDEFYLTGLYKADVANYSDNAECYISGGRFGIVAGAGQEGIGDASKNTGNITWQIDHADIDEFYGGGINKDMVGNITTVISNSHVGRFCGGPKFGDMPTGKAVITTATNCTFGTYFGAGYGGNAYSREAPTNRSSNIVNTDWNNWITANYKQEYKASFGGVSTQFNYQFLPLSSNTTNVARIFIEYVKFSLATCRAVTSKLTGCTVTGNFYGGGSLGKVDGNVNSTLKDCTINGSAFGAGYSASLPDVMVDAIGFEVEPYYYEQLGSYRAGVKYAENDLYKPVKYTWQQANTVNSTDTGIDKVNHFLFTTEDLKTLGTVTGNVKLTIDGTTTVGGSVYGGGEESGVGGNTTVSVTGGTIGSEGQGGAEYGNVYGGGKGKRDNIAAGQVKGSTKVAISNGTIYHNVYGGGAYGSVGDFDYDDTTGLPTGLKTGAAENSGKTEVYITGGTFGWNGKENGMVFGSSRGDVGAPGSLEDKMAWVYDTHVAIGDTVATTTTTATPVIKGSVYGGGENGHNLRNAYVRINGGTIGIPTGDNVVVGSTTYEPYNYPYRGNVYGGGCGTDKYYSDPSNVANPYDGNGDRYNSLAGIVKGNALVNMTAGYVVHNVYGAGAMGSVGNGGSGGKTTVNISDGRIGYDGSRNGNVFGAARGEYGTSTAASGLANVKETEVNISYTTTPTGDNTDKTAQLIAGSVFGGGESGTVKGSVAVNMTGGLILKDIYGGGALADTQTSNWDATNNTWAEGKTSASSTTTVRLTGGTIQGEAYGGGLGETEATEAEDKPAYVYGNVLIDLNGTTTSGETGTPLDENTRGCAVHDIFGCNNANGTPKGNVLVHIYATQNKTKSQIGNTSGETPVTDAKVKGSYDVLAVYGGGNLAAYEPADAFSTDETTKASATTNVIIDGCGLTSIQQVYGGGNAASTPATKVTVNGTYEIEELFGGGNGKDDIVVNSTTLPNPGANVGFYAYADDATDAQTPEDRATNYGYGSGKASVNVYGGTIHRVFGGSNTKGNVRQTAVTLLDDYSGCDFCVDEAYGGGKSAPMDAEAKLLMACIPGLNAAYGGAEAADIQGNVTLNISNGTFDRVFGGNNLSGTISGSITVNVEEVGCKPVIIGELYGGGNQAGYSVYGYNSDGSLIESGTTPLYSDPQVNVKSFTSIGTIYGGGYGIGAKMVGSPTVNINEVVGTPETYPTTGDDYNATGFKGKTKEIDGHEVVIPAHTRTKIGAINNVFGGGNAAEVKGNTTVNIGTLTEVYLVKNVTVGDAVTDYYTRNNDGTYTAATGTATEGTTYYEKKTVVGADIRGNVYGGGNNAAVTGNTSVNIGKKND